MLRSLWLSGIFGLFLVAGFAAPFAAALGYVWVDTFQPQSVAYSIITEIPTSQVMAITALITYLARDRRHPPRFTFTMLFMALLLLWCTYTTYDAPAVPEEALIKLSWGGKTMLFALFMPFIFRSRVQIEAFLQVWIFALAAQFLPFAGKTLLSGGHYGTSYGLVAGNAGLAEGSTLSTVCMIACMISLYLARHQTLLPNTPLVRAMYYGVAAACVIAGIGTYERDALVGMAIVVGALWLKTERKLLWTGVGAVGALAIAVWLLRPDSDWVARMSTISDPHESSFYGRLLVWEWTWNYVKEHPFGGGFYAYMIDNVTYPPTPGYPDPIVVHGKAFHSIYFELLGEQGWPGLFLFAAIVVSALASLLGVRRRARRMEGMAWVADLAVVGLTAIIIILACGAFISIAFTPMVHYTFALSIMLREYLSRARRREREVALQRTARLAAQAAAQGTDIASLGHATA